MNSIPDEELKKLQVFNAMMVKGLSDLVATQNISLERLELLGNKTEEIISQLSFWIERENYDRFYSELAMHMVWVMDNFKQDLKKLKNKDV